MLRRTTLFFFLIVTAPLLAKTLDEVRLSARGYLTTDDYVHGWYPFPTLKGTDLDGKAIEIAPEKTKVNTYIVIASWCIKCQNLMDYMKVLTKKFLPVNSKFIYVFAHDTAADAKGFIDAYKINESSILATPEVLKDLHNPQLPSILVADRNGWLLTRFESTTRPDLDKLETLVGYLTSY